MGYVTVNLAAVKSKYFYHVLLFLWFTPAQSTHSYFLLHAISRWVRVDPPPLPRCLCSGLCFSLTVGRKNLVPCFCTSQFVWLFPSSFRETFSWTLSFGKVSLLSPLKFLCSAHANALLHDCCQLFSLSLEKLMFLTHKRNNSFLHTCKS